MCILDLRQRTEFLPNRETAETIMNNRLLACVLLTYQTSLESTRDEI